MMSSEYNAYTVHEWANGKREWRNSAGDLHRVGGPAVIYPDGTQVWYLRGNMHRVDGPAIVGSDGSTQYWIHGVRISEREFADRNVVCDFIIFRLRDSHNGLIVTVEVYDDGKIKWRNSAGDLHRVGGPAVEHSNGRQSWWLNGLRHREDGPAVVMGPNQTSYDEYWLHGRKCSGKENHKKLMEQKRKYEDSCHGKIVEIDGKNYKLELVL